MRKRILTASEMQTELMVGMVQFQQLPKEILELQNPRAWTILLPLPPIELSPNRSVNWRFKHKKKCQYSEDAQGLIRAAHVPALSKCKIHYEFFLNRDYRQATNDRDKIQLLCYRDNLYFPRDKDNAQAAMKCVQDALVKVGILKSDSADHVVGVTVDLHARKADHKGCTSVWMTITEVLDEEKGVQKQ